MARMQSPSLALSVILCCLASWFHQASAINFLALPSAFGGSCAEVHQVVHICQALVQRSHNCTLLLGVQDRACVSAPEPNGLAGGVGLIVYGERQQQPQSTQQVTASPAHLASTSSNGIDSSTANGTGGPGSGSQTPATTQGTSTTEEGVVAAQSGDSIARIFDAAPQFGHYAADADSAQIELTTRCLSLFLDTTALEHVQALRPDMVLHDAQFLCGTYLGAMLGVPSAAYASVLRPPLEQLLYQLPEPVSEMPVYQTGLPRRMRGVLQAWHNARAHWRFASQQYKLHRSLDLHVAYALNLTGAREGVVTLLRRNTRLLLVQGHPLVTLLPRELPHHVKVIGPVMSPSTSEKLDASSSSSGSATSAAGGGITKHNAIGNSSTTVNTDLQQPMTTITSSRVTPFQSALHSISLACNASTAAEDASKDSKGGSKSKSRKSGPTSPACAATQALISNLTSNGSSWAVVVDVSACGPDGSPITRSTLSTCTALVSALAALKPLPVLMRHSSPPVPAADSVEGGSSAMAGSKEGSTAGGGSKAGPPSPGSRSSLRLTKTGILTMPNLSDLLKEHGACNVVLLPSSAWSLTELLSTGNVAALVTGPSTSAFLSAASHGVPVVSWPVHGDELDAAKRVEDIGMGVTIGFGRKRSTSKPILQAIVQVLKDPRIKARAAAAAAALTSSPLAPAHHAALLLEAAYASSPATAQLGSLIPTGPSAAARAAAFVAAATTLAGLALLALWMWRTWPVDSFPGRSAVVPPGMSPCVVGYAVTGGKLSPTPSFRRNYSSSNMTAGEKVGSGCIAASCLGASTSSCTPATSSLKGSKEVQRKSSFACAAGSTEGVPLLNHMPSEEDSTAGIGGTIGSTNGGTAFVPQHMAASRTPSMPVWSSPDRPNAHQLPSGGPACSGEIEEEQVSASPSKQRRHRSTMSWHSGNWSPSGLAGMAAGAASRGAAAAFGSGGGGGKGLADGDGQA